jgi:light-regulated signal transduction histidine kinase (bacteriophytochrome)
VNSGNEGEIADSTRFVISPNSATVAYVLTFPPQPDIGEDLFSVAITGGASTLLNTNTSLLFGLIYDFDIPADNQRVVWVGTAQEDAGSLRLTVADAGSGLSAEAQARLFDAFWTTKPDGIGIGLSISRSIVEASGGRIWAAPRSPCGAVFGVCLPIAKPGARP